MFFFFFQAEDGIRDVAVTGVQTCALPICVEAVASAPSGIGRRRRAGRGRGGGSRAFERGESGLELLETGPRALEHPRLGVELVPGHQIELAESLAQHRAEVALEVPLHAAQRRGHALEQAPCELIDTK